MDGTAVDGTAGDITAADSTAANLIRSGRYSGIIKQVFCDIFFIVVDAGAIQNIVLINDQMYKSYYIIIIDNTYYYRIFRFNNLNKSIFQEIRFDEKNQFDLEPISKFSYFFTSA